MNRLEHLLTILTEECAEVQQAATKSLRFGLDEGRDIATTNREQLRRELNDLVAIVEMLNKEGAELTLDRRLRDNKKSQVERYLDYSRECGTLSGDHNEV